MTVILLDDSFTGWSGHNASYNISIAEELQRRSLDVRIFSHLSAIDVANDHSYITPLFRNYGALRLLQKPNKLPRPISQLARLAQANKSQLSDLTRGVSEHVSKGDLIVVCVQSAATTFAYSLWLRQLAHVGKEVTTLFVVHSPPSRTFKFEVLLLRRLSKTQPSGFAAHSIRVADLCTVQAGVRPHILPFPHINPTLPSCSSLDMVDVNPLRLPLKFTFLGLASWVKGFDTLVDTIPLVAEELTSNNISFTIQCHIHPPSDRMSEKQQQLQAFAHQLPNIRLVSGGLTAANYGALLETSDVIVVPNRSEAYRYVLSSVFAEAIASAKPVIVASGSCMADTLVDQGAGVLFESADRHSLAQAIRQASVEFSKLKKRATENAPGWRSIHNPISFVNHLLQIGSRREHV